MPEKILHINIPFFLSSVESLCNSSLRDRALIFVSSDSPFSAVLDISETAYKAGIRCGMTVAEARKTERNLILIRPEKNKYSSALNKIKSLLCRFTPLCEILPSGEAYLDIRGTARMFGTAEDFAMKTFREIYAQTGLRSHIGIGSSKLISRAASSFFTSDIL
ncbi:MAG: hypothetical protein N3B13_07210, partial [Deltaproteobacteria bacterium]|nr:hypothetical protein [Deltaproteobacteria bacterium]